MSKRLQVLCCLLLLVACCGGGPAPERMHAAVLPSQETALLLHASFVQLQRERSGSRLSVAIVGDSLLRQQFDVLCAALTTPAMPAANNSTSGRVCSALNVTLVYAPSTCGGMKALDTVLRHTNGSRLDVLYFDAGLHLLHLGSARPFESIVPTPENMYTMVHTLLTAARNRLGVRQTILFQSHAICTSLFIGDYARAVASLTSDDPDRLANECMRNVKEEKRYITVAMKPRVVKGITLSEAATVCRRALFTSDGVRYINALVTNATLAFEPAADLIDGFKITNNACWASKPGDGRHYPALLPAEARLLIEKLRR